MNIIVPKAGSEVQSSHDQSSTTHSAAENVQQEGVQVLPTNQTTPESVKDTCQTITDHTIEGIH